MFWDSWIATGKRMKLDFYFTQPKKVNLKLISEINVGAKAIKLY